MRREIFLYKISSLATVSMYLNLNNCCWDFCRAIGRSRVKSHRGFAPCRFHFITRTSADWRTEFQKAIVWNLGCNELLERTQKKLIIFWCEVRVILPSLQANSLSRKYHWLLVSPASFNFHGKIPQEMHHLQRFHMHISIFCDHRFPLRVFIIYRRYVSLTDLKR